MQLSHSVVEENKNQKTDIIKEVSDFSKNMHNIQKRYESYEKLESLTC